MEPNWYEYEQGDPAAELETEPPDFSMFEMTPMYGRTYGPDSGDLELQYLPPLWLEGFEQSEPPFDFQGWAPGGYELPPPIYPGHPLLSFQPPAYPLPPRTPPIYPGHPLLSDQPPAYPLPPRTPPIYPGHPYLSDHERALPPHEGHINHHQPPVEWIPPPPPRHRVEALPPPNFRYDPPAPHQRWHQFDVPQHSEDFRNRRWLAYRTPPIYHPGHNERWQPFVAPQHGEDFRQQWPPVYRTPPIHAPGPVSRYGQQSDQQDHPMPRNWQGPPVRRYPQHR